MEMNESGIQAVHMDFPHNEFVPVMMAHDLEEAQSYKAILESHNIPVLLESERGGDKILIAYSRSVPVLVPDHMHDRASQVVEEIQTGTPTELRMGDDDFEDEEYEEDFEDDDFEDEDFDEDFDDDDFEDDDEFEDDDFDE